MLKVTANESSFTVLTANLVTLTKIFGLRAECVQRITVELRTQGHSVVHFNNRPNVLNARFITIIQPVANEQYFPANEVTEDSIVPTTK